MADRAALALGLALPECRLAVVLPDRWFDPELSAVVLGWCAVQSRMSEAATAHR